MGAARPFEQLRPAQQRLIDLLLMSAEDPGRAVGDLGIAPDEHAQVLLVALGLGPVDDALVKGVRGLRAHAAQHAEDAFLPFHVVPQLFFS